VLRAAGETETTQIQDWLQMDEGDPEFQPMTKKEIAEMFFIYPTLLMLLNFPVISFLRSLILRLTFASLIRMTSLLR
jgi:hypothetical protein